MALGGWSPWPPTAAKVRALGAVLKDGGYISAATYFLAYRVTAERRGMSFDDPSVRALKDYKRSALRGMGPGQQAMELPFERLGDLPKGSKVFGAFGPDVPPVAP